MMKSSICIALVLMASAQAYWLMGIGECSNYYVALF